MGREGRVNGEDESREGAGGVKGDFPESVGMDKGGSRVDRGGMEFPRLQHAFFTQRLELRHPWTIARGTAAFKEYQYVRLERGGRMAWGEAAHNARYGESLASVRAGLEAGWALVEAGDLAGSAERLSRLGSGLPRAAVAALEMALVDLEGKEQERRQRQRRRLRQQHQRQHQQRLLLSLLLILLLPLLLLSQRQQKQKRRPPTISTSSSRWSRRSRTREDS